MQQTSSEPENNLTTSKQGEVIQAHDLMPIFVLFCFCFVFFVVVEIFEVHIVVVSDPALAGFFIALTFFPDKAKIKSAIPY